MQGLDKCVENTSSLICETGAISRREFKKDISYVGDAERQELASEVLSIPLARYRYRSEPEGGKKHLGFIIDDMREGSPAVAADRTHVDEYGYASMLLATVQQQQEQIDDLKRQVEALREERASCAHQ
jgi:hypothetical protein